MALSSHLPEHIRTYIREQVETGAFPSEEAVITDAVERTMDGAEPWADPGTHEALAQYQRGEGEEWTPDVIY